MKLCLTRGLVMAGALLALPLSLTGRPVQAQTVYNSQASFENFLQGSSQISSTVEDTFNGLGNNSANYTDFGSRLTLNGITFTTGSTDQIDVISPSAGPSGYDYGTEDTLSAFDNATTEYTEPITVSVPTNTYAFGLDLGDFNGDAVTITVNGTPYSVTDGVPSGQGGNGFNFFGISQATPITSVLLTPTAGMNGQVYDDVTVGLEAAPTPESTSAASLSLLLAAGAGAVALGRRRKQKA